jgi:DNA polymerase III epsilon subunit-like protein
MWPHILQISWQVIDSETWLKESEYDSYIQLRCPWNGDAERIHQIPEAIVRELGKEPADIFRQLGDVLKSCDIVISHNMMFDKTVILSEFQRLKESGVAINPRSIWPIAKKEICTMNRTREFCGIKFANSNDFKYPKLNELYFRLFGVSYDISGALLHNSKNDVSCLISCFKKMLDEPQFAQLLA